MLLRTDTIPNSLCLQVHMDFRVQVCVNGQRLHNEDLLFERIYVSEDNTCDLARTWGCGIWFGGRLSTTCISLHFTFWHAGDRSHFWLTCLTYGHPQTLFLVLFPPMRIVRRRMK